MLRKLSILLLPALAWGAERLTLQQAQDLALRNSPRWEASKAQAAAAREIPAEIGAARKPQMLASSTGALSEDSNTRILAGGLNVPLVLNRWGTGVTVSQMITDFGRTKWLERSARERSNAAVESSRAARANVLLRVARAYYGTLSARAVRKIAAETVKTRALVADRAAALAANQLRSDLDVSFARVDLQEARLLESNAANDELSAFVELSTAIGLAPPRDFDLVEEPLPGVMDATWDEVLREASANRPEIRQAQLEADAAAALVRAEKALRMPTVGVAGTSGWAPFHVERLQGHWNAAGFTVQVPVLNGGLFRARQREAEARAAAAAAEARDVTYQIARDVRIAFLNAKNADERYRLTADLVVQSKRSYHLAKARYDLGLGSIVELSQAQLSQTRSEITQATALFEYQLSRVALEFQKGAL